MIAASAYFRKKPTAYAFCFALITGLLAHGFALVNSIYNHDSIAMITGGVGTGIASGRWALELWKYVAKWADLHYSLPLLNGLIFLILLSLSAAVIVDTFHVSSVKIAACIGAIFTTFPSATSTFFFCYTLIPYGVAILCSVLTARLLHTHKFGFLLGVILISISMGIYQAYIPITISMLVILLIYESLSGNATFIGIVKKGVYFCGILIAGAVFYFLCVTFFLNFFNTELGTYQGIDKMGKIALSDIPILLLRTYKKFFIFPFIDYYKLSHSKLQTITYCLLATSAVWIVFFTLMVKIRKPIMSLLTIALCALLPLAINFIVFICPNGTIYTLMAYGFVFAPCFPLLIYSQLPQCDTAFCRWSIHINKKILGFFACVLIFLNTCYANLNYSALHQSNQQIISYITSIITQVRMTEGFDTNKKWAFIGTLQDPLFECDAYNGDYIYGGNSDPKKLLNDYSACYWFQQSVGYHYPAASTEEIIDLQNLDAVKDMVNWPNEGSIKILDDYIIIKFSADSQAE